MWLALGVSFLMHSAHLPVEVLPTLITATEMLCAASNVHNNMKMTVKPEEICCLDPQTMFTEHAVQSKDENKIHMKLLCLTLLQIILSLLWIRSDGNEIWIKLVKERDLANPHIERTRRNSDSPSVSHEPWLLVL
ncbi:hypothetical protein PENSPDRAFT_672604 [Peniophora sp. CONT]|nr:hypothetical protein PENSPDRAFT_672604 [Peniophora sp. CONT]